MKEESKFYSYNGKIPVLGDNIFIAPGAKVIGDVVIGDNSSVWYNTVIRGDVNFIKIGAMTNVQDCSMLHVTIETNPLIIGSKVTIGHSVNLHGCTVEDSVLIGIGAIVLDGAYIESNSIVAAGTVITPGYRVPSGKMVAGVPVKIIRDLTKKEIEYFEISAERYLKYSQITRESLCLPLNFQN